MPSRCCEFVDSRLRRSPPDRASAVPYGQAGENAIRFPHLVHRSAAAHKLHSTPQQHGMILISGNGETSSRLDAFSLFFPGSCPNNRDRRTISHNKSDVAFGNLGWTSDISLANITARNMFLWARSLSVEYHIENAVVGNKPVSTENKCPRYS